MPGVDEGRWDKGGVQLAPSGSAHPGVDDDVLRLHRQLEVPSWAPWLRFGPAQLQRQREVFPEGQLVIWREDGVPLAMLSTNRVAWSGETVDLTTWDDVAGEGGGLDGAFDPNGNTMAFLSISVSREVRSRGYAQVLVAGALDRASSLGLEHVVGDFRPSGYGQYKRLTGDFDIHRYSVSRRPDGLLVDRWLRIVSGFGARFHKVDPRAMVIDASVDELEVFQRSRAAAWWRVTEPGARRQLIEMHRPFDGRLEVGEIWECGEAGSWFVDRSREAAQYIEANVWAELDIDASHRSARLSAGEALHDAVAPVIDLRVPSKQRD